MPDGKSEKAKLPYASPRLKPYGDFATLTASGSGTLVEFTGEPPGQRMMRRP